MSTQLCSFDSRLKQFLPVTEEDARENREKMIFKIFQAVGIAQTAQIPDSAIPDAVYRISLSEDHPDKFEIRIYMGPSCGELVFQGQRLGFSSKVLRVVMPYLYNPGKSIETYCYGNEFEYIDNRPQKTLPSQFWDHWNEKGTIGIQYTKTIYPMCLTALIRLLMQQVKTSILVRPLKLFWPSVD